MHKRFVFALCLMFTALLLSGCAAPQKSTLTIAEQYGIAYAPLQVMKQEGILEKALPDVTVRWVQMGGPTAIREGMLAGQIDVGFMGIGPMLIGVDTGMAWKCFTALSANEVAFMTNRENVHSLADLGEKDRIAILSPGSTQHILLCMAAEKQLGRADALDNRLVSLSHPDAMSAMLAGGEVALHVATPPYTDLERENGMHSILSGTDVTGGPFTFICGVAGTALYNERRPVYDALQRCLKAAVAEMNADLPAAAQKLAPAYGVAEATLLAEMSYQGSIYDTALRGVEPFAQAMARLGLLSAAPTRSAFAYDDVEVLP